MINFCDKQNHCIVIERIVSIVIYVEAYILVKRPKVTTP